LAGVCAPILQDSEAGNAPVERVLSEIALISTVEKRTPVVQGCPVSFIGTIGSHPCAYSSIPRGKRGHTGMRPPLHR
jgi:hypothetical protein